MAQNSSLENRYILDSTALIDGRIVSLFENRILAGKILIPRISYEIARENAAGRYSMATLQRLDCRLSILPTLNGISEADEVISTAQESSGTVVTVSDLLKQKALNLGLAVINIKELLRLLLPKATPGDVIRVRIVKRGKGSGEGVGYLEFGVKVVVNRAGDKIGKEVSAIVKNALTTPSGMVLFAELA